MPPKINRFPWTETITAGAALVVIDANHYAASPVYIPVKQKKSRSIN